MPRTAPLAEQTGVRPLGAVEAAALVGVVVVLAILLLRVLASA